MPSKEQGAARLAKGLCNRCGKKPFLEGRTVCDGCGNGPARRIAELKKQGLCKVCGLSPSVVMDRCQTCENNRPKSTPRSLVCECCKKTFIQPDIRGPVPKRCSTACTSKQFRRRQKPESYFAPRPCLHCGNIFSISRYGTEQHCGISCYKSWYYQQNKEQLDAYRGQWSKDNRALQDSYAAKSWEKRLDYYRAQACLHQNRRRIRQQNNSGSHTFEERNELKVAFDYCCAHCERPHSESPLTRDHIIPVSKGGTDDITNIQPLCRSCNARKHDALPGEPYWSPKEQVA